ncbi:MAG: family 10 glycosylhydrolase [Fimbriimonadales bacterium]
MGRIIGLLVLIGGLISSSAMAQDTQKLRGMWVDVFHDGIKTPNQVEQLMSRARKARVNTLFIQVRSRAQVYHMSLLEPRALDAMPLFDGLKHVILMAHAQDPPIQVHAWINAHPLWETKSDPPWKDHVLFKHKDWLTQDPKGNTSTEVGRALDFGHPLAADYLTRLYKEVAENYNVDGVHLDFIRFTGKEWGYNPVSVERFYESLQTSQREQVLVRSRAAGYTKPATRAANSRESFFPGAEKTGAEYAAEGLPATNDPLWNEWRRKQVTNLVAKVSKAVKEIKPKIVVSVAAIPWGDAPNDFTQSAAYARCFQDWKGWAQDGIVDLVLPMLYFRESSHASYFRNWVSYCNALKPKAKSHIAAGIGNWLNSPTQTMTQSRIADAKLDGVCYFSYASTNPFPGKEAQLFNPEFYAAIGALPLAKPLGPITVVSE